MKHALAILLIALLPTAALAAIVNPSGGGGNTPGTYIPNGNISNATPFSNTCAGATVTIGAQAEYDCTLTASSLATITLAAPSAPPTNGLYALLIDVCQDGVTGNGTLAVTAPNGWTLAWTADGGTLQQPSTATSACTLYQLKANYNNKTLTEAIPYLPATVLQKAAVQTCAANHWLGAVDSTGASANCTVPAAGFFRMIEPANSGLTAMATTTTSDLVCLPGSCLATSESQIQSAWPVAGTFKNLQCNVANVAGASNSYALTVRTCTPSSGACTGTDSSVTCTITGTSAKTCSDTSDSVTIAAGDFVDLHANVTVGGTTPSATPLRCTVEFDL